MGVGEVISAIRRLTKEQITESLNEWDLISREKFLEIHRVHAAKKYWIRREDKRYDAKAILVRALRSSDASLIDLNANSFDGNEFTVAEPLRSLGFVVEENSHPPKFWWVNQNQTFDEEIGGGFMWSPKTNSNGARNQFYDNMKAVQPGDVVFSFCDTRIKAIGRVLAPAQTQARPDFHNPGKGWSNEGWFVETDFAELENQIRPKDHINQLRDLLPDKYAPLQSDGNGKQSVYLANVPDEMAGVLIELIGREVSGKIDLLVDLEKIAERPSDELEHRIVERTDIGEVERVQLLRSRRGQGVFKRNVMLHENSCRVTNVSDIRHLRASHIKPWRMSDDREKLSGSNGLLLSPHIDHLFDQGWISFGEKEEILVSSKITIGLTDAWGIDLDHKVGKFTDAQSDFLEFHRSEIFRA
jgi:putative restriction endonuclease